MTATAKDLTSHRAGLAPSIGVRHLGDLFLFIHPASRKGAIIARISGQRVAKGFRMGGDCLDSPSRFSIINAASSYSALTGVVAGVLFTGIVLLVGIRSSGKAEDDRKAALEVMTPTLFMMVVSSFLFAVIAGEGVCRRADMEGLAAGSFLAVSGVATFEAIAWMLKSLQSEHGVLNDIAATSHFAVATIALLQVAITVTDVQSEYGRSSRAELGIWAFLGVGLFTMAILIFRWRTRRSLPAVDASWATPALIVSLVINLSIFDLAANASPPYWTSSDPPLLVTVGCVGVLVGLLGCVVVLLLGAPRRA